MENKPHTLDNGFRKFRNFLRALGVCSGSLIMTSKDKRSQNKKYPKIIRKHKQKHDLCLKCLQSKVSFLNPFIQFWQGWIKLNLNSFKKLIILIKSSMMNFSLIGPDDPGYSKAMMQRHLDMKRRRSKENTSSILESQNPIDKCNEAKTASSLTAAGKMSLSSLPHSNFNLKASTPNNEGNSESVKMKQLYKS